MTYDDCLKLAEFIIREPNTRIQFMIADAISDAYHRGVLDGIDKLEKKLNSKN